MLIPFIIVLSWISSNLLAISGWMVVGCNVEPPANRCGVLMICLTASQELLTDIACTRCMIGLGPRIPVLKNHYFVGMYSPPTLVLIFLYRSTQVFVISKGLTLSLVYNTVSCTAWINVLVCILLQDCKLDCARDQDLGCCPVSIHPSILRTSVSIAS